MATNTYVSQAKNQLKGQLESNKNNLQNNFNQNMNDLESQKGEINKEYDGYVEDSKNAGETNKQNYNNATLNRGLGRSSIATTGIAGIQNTTDKNVISVNTQRQSQMDNIAKLKDMLRNNLTNTLSSLDSEHNSNVNSLAMQLQQRAEDVSYRNKQLAQDASQANADLSYKYAALKQSQSQANAELAYKYSALKQSQETATAKTTKTASKSNLPSLSNFKSQLSGMDALKSLQILEKNRPELIEAYGPSGYTSLLDNLKKSDPFTVLRFSNPITRSQIESSNKK